MEIQQIAVFLENKPGHLRTVCHTLAEAGISIITLSLADTQQYGILRLLIDDCEKACRVLSEAGFVVNTTTVLAIEVVDKPGALLHILSILFEGDVNIEYMYTITSHRGKNAVMVFRFDNPDKAIELFHSKGIRVLSNNDILKSDW